MISPYKKCFKNTPVMLIRDRVYSSVTVDSRRIKLSLCLINYAPCHEYVLRSGGIAPSFLTSTLDGNEQSASQPDHFTYRGRVPGTHRTGGWVTTRVSRDAVEKRITYLPGNEQ
jgi:hypothetical protein